MEENTSIITEQLIFALLEIILRELKKFKRLQMKRQLHLRTIKIYTERRVDASRHKNKGKYNKPIVLRSTEQISHLLSLKPINFSPIPWTVRYGNDVLD